jgi:hypothetical protein
MRMYIANGTHQNIDFQYRLPETKSYRQQNIPIGGQIRISGELSAKDIDAIVEHHVIYGMVHAKEISNFKGFLIPYVYSIDEPVTVEIMTELIVQNREFNRLLGIKQRQEAAVTVNQQIEDQFPENMKNNLKNLEMTVEELPSKDRDPTINEGVRVTRDKEKGAPQDPDKNPFDFQQALNKKRSMF